jgi:hypothetical protein
MNLRWLAALIVILTVIPSLAADREFKAVLKAVEKQYGIHHTRIPFMGLGFKFYHPDGVHIGSLAVFENLKGDRKVSMADLDEIVAHSLGSNWQPVLHTKSRHENESTVVYVDSSRPEVRMFVADIERYEATIIKMSIPDVALRDWLDEPDGRKKHDLLDWGSH